MSAGDFEIVNQRETGKCLDVIVLNNKTKTFERKIEDGELVQVSKEEENRKKEN